MANDPVQKLREAIVAVLDTRPEIVALTGRPEENIVAWGNMGEVSDADLKAGMIAYHVIAANEVACDQNPQSIPVQFGAMAGEESIANEIVGIISRVVDAPAFLALVPPIDASVTKRSRTPYPFDAQEGLARADIEITLRAYFP